MPAPGENQGFTEKGRYVFEMPRGEWSLLIDDEPLPIGPGNETCWTWEPGFFAGEVTAVLAQQDGKASIIYLLDVSPDPMKLGRDVFRRMLEEIWKRDPELVIGSEPATIQTGKLGATQNAWLEFARLRRYAPEFLRALAPIHAKPRRTLWVQRDSSMLHHVRRVDRRTAASVARSAAIALFLPDSDEAPVFSPDMRLDVPVVEDTLDAAANRAMLALMQAVLRRARSLVERLQELVENESPSETRTSLRQRWPTRRNTLDDLIVQLQSGLRRVPFVDVRRPEVTAAGLTAIASDPVYARAWGRGWRALRHGLDRDEQTDRLWMSPSWEIYERWCFVRLCTLLATAAPGWNWVSASEPTKFVGAQEERRAELQLQTTFKSREQETDARWSISKERVPDLVLTVYTPGDVRFMVLDSKYRTTRANVLDAMAATHIYQDSLRIGARRPYATLLLVPAGGGAPWLEDPSFQEAHRVGVHVFSLESATLPLQMSKMLNNGPTPQVS